MSCRTIERTVLDGMANPTPSEPPDSLSICALTPITRPRPSSSGPPELPWLIAASVWIVSVIVKLFGAVISRWSALTIPLVIVPSSPNGLPMRENRVTDVDRARVGERQRSEQRRRRIDPEHGEVGRRIRADELGVELDSVPEAHRDRGRAGDDVLVRDDVTVPVVDEAGSLRALRLRAAARRDLDDGLRRAVVDLGCRETADRDGLGAVDRHLTYDRRRAVVEHGERGGAEPEAEGESGDQPEDDERRARASGSHAFPQCGGSRSVPAEQRVRGG